MKIDAHFDEAGEIIKILFTVETDEDRQIVSHWHGQWLVCRTTPDNHEQVELAKPVTIGATGHAVGLVYQFK